MGGGTCLRARCSPGRTSASGFVRFGVPSSPRGVRVSGVRFGVPRRRRGRGARRRGRRGAAGHARHRRRRPPARRDRHRHEHRHRPSGRADPARREDRAAPSTSPSAARTRRPAAPTSPPSTGTSSAGPTASPPTASRSTSRGGRISVRVAFTAICAAKSTRTTRIAALASAQHGVVARWQLLALGLGADAIDQPRRARTAPPPSPRGLRRGPHGAQGRGPLDGGGPGAGR